MVKKVLFLYPNPSTIDYEHSLINRVSFTQIKTVPEVMALFENDGLTEYDLIMVTVMRPFQNIGTPGLTRRICEIYQGPILVVSANRDFRNLIKESGADHEAKSPEEAQKKITELLEL
ncbi:hypothetical protein ACFLZY_02365 [Patescibacteria group bacterium]